MVKRISLIGLIMLATVSCITRPQKGVSNPSPLPETAIDSDTDLYSGLIDTILLSDNAILVYKSVSKDSFTSVWGESIKGEIHVDTLPIFPSGLPTLLWNNNDLICLRQSCGTSCFFAYVMLFETGEVKQFMYPMAYDMVNNYIAYSDDNPDGFLVVENLLTGDKQIIAESYDHKLGPLSVNAIDSIRFVSSELYVKWRGNESQIMERLFEISQ